jgi:hypothetical protein
VLAVEPSATLILAIGSSTTGRSTFVIVKAVVAEALPAVGAKLSTALQLTVYEPAWLKFGVPESVMLGAAEGPAEAGPARNAAWFVCDSVTSWPASGSEAEPVIETRTFSVPETVAGAAMTGFEFVSVIVRAVVAAAVPAGTLTSVADQLIVKLPVAAGVPVSVMLGFKEGPAELEAVKNGALLVCDRVTF